MNPSEEIDKYIALHSDWRGATLANIRKMILGVVTVYATSFS